MPIEINIMPIEINHDPASDLYEVLMPGLPPFFCYEYEQAEHITEIITELYRKTFHAHAGETIETIKAKALLGALDKHNGNQSAAAKSLGMKRTTFIQAFKRSQCLELLR